MDTIIPSSSPEDLSPTSNQPLPKAGKLGGHKIEARGNGDFPKTSKAGGRIGAEGNVAPNKKLDGHKVKTGAKGVSKKFGDVVKPKTLEESMERFVGVKKGSSHKAMEIFTERLPELEKERKASFRDRASLTVNEYKMVLKGKYIYVYGKLGEGGQKQARLAIRVDREKGEIFEGVQAKPKSGVKGARRSLERFGKSYKNMKEQIFLEKEIRKSEGRGLRRTVSTKFIGKVKGKVGLKDRLGDMKRELRRLKVEFDEEMERAPEEQAKLGELKGAILKEMGGAKGKELEELSRFKEKVEGYLDGDTGRYKEVKWIGDEIDGYIEGAGREEREGLRALREKVDGYLKGGVTKEQLIGLQREVLDYQGAKADAYEVAREDIEREWQMGELLTKMGAPFTLKYSPDGLTDLCSGGDAEQFVARGPLSPEGADTRCELFEQMATAVGFSLDRDKIGTMEAAREPEKELDAGRRAVLELIKAGGEIPEGFDEEELDAVLGCLCCVDLKLANVFVERDAEGGVRALLADAGWLEEGEKTSSFTPLNMAQEEGGRWGVKEKSTSVKLGYCLFEMFYGGREARFEEGKNFCSVEYMQGGIAKVLEPDNPLNSLILELTKPLTDEQMAVYKSNNEEAIDGIEKERLGAFEAVGKMREVREWLQKPGSLAKLEETRQAFRETKAQDLKEAVKKKLKLEVDKDDLREKDEGEEEEVEETEVTEAEVAEGGEEEFWETTEDIKASKETETGVIEEEEGDFWETTEEVKAQIKEPSKVSTERVEKPSVGEGNVRSLEAMGRIEELEREGMREAAIKEVKQMKEQIQQLNRFAREKQIETVQNRVDTNAEQCPNAHRLISGAMKDARKRLTPFFIEGHRGVFEKGKGTTIGGVDDPSKRDEIFQKCLKAAPKHIRKEMERHYREGKIEWLTTAETNRILNEAEKSVDDLFDNLNRNLDRILQELNEKKKEEKEEKEKEVVLAEERGRSVQKDEIKREAGKKEEGRREELRVGEHLEKRKLKKTEKAVLEEQRRKDREFAKAQKEDLLKTKEREEEIKTEQIRKQEEGKTSK